jgi:hypothetical protein
MSLSKIELCRIGKKRTQRRMNSYDDLPVNQDSVLSFLNKYTQGHFLVFFFLKGFYESMNQCDLGTQTYKVGTMNKRDTPRRRDIEVDRYVCVLI